MGTRLTSGSLPLKLLLLAASLCVAFAGLEVLVRARQYWKYGSAAPTVYNFTTDQATGLKIPTPGSNRAGIAINSLGFRGPEIAMPKPKATVRLAFLGASTTFCAEISSNDLVWPHLVTEELRKRYPDVNFDYVNAAVPGFTTAESLKNLEARVAPLDPDVVVFYEATNDLARDTRQLAEDQGLTFENSKDTSVLAEWSVLWFLLEKNWAFLQRHQAAQSPKTRLTFDPRETSRGFESRLEALVEQAQHEARLVVLVTFSHRMRREQSDIEKLLASELSLYYMPSLSVEGLLDGFDEYNRVIREVAERRGAVLVGGEDEIPGDEIHFADSVHFTDAGSRRMANRVASVLGSAIPFQELVAKVVAADGSPRR
jgi:lysophospholipase L1-like esterase